MPSDQILKLYDTFARLRRANIGVIDSVPPERLDVVPKGLHNNIRWQAGHIVTVQASLLHRRFGRDIPVPEHFFQFFAKGTSPEGWDANTPSFSVIRAALEQAVVRTRAELDDLVDLRYPEPFTVTAGLTLASFPEGLAFLSIHEAIHLGELITMSRML